MSDEKRLIKQLLTNYETVGVVGRPVFNHSQTIRVKYGISLVQILDLNEKDQVLTTNVWNRYVSRFVWIHRSICYATAQARNSSTLGLSVV
jgi:Neurotransmitter-gated ion-channel ligand binding domain